MAWFALGCAQLSLTNHKEAVEAFDQVSPSFRQFVDALNNSGSIYFERLKDDRAAYQRFTRAVLLAPNDVLCGLHCRTALGRPRECFGRTRRDGPSHQSGCEARKRGERERREA